MTRYLRQMRGLRLPEPDLLSTMKIGALGAVFGSLWDPPKERGPSVLEGLVVTPPSEELLARIDRAERGEEEMPKMEPNVTTAPMSFGDALAALKAGKRVARTGWNGKGMWLALVRPYEYPGDHSRGNKWFAKLDITDYVPRPAGVPDDVEWVIGDTLYGKREWPDGRGSSSLALLPWIGMKTADDGFVPWLASQTDLLAEDWVLLAADWVKVV